MRFGSVPYFNVPVSRLALGSIVFDENRQEEGFAIIDEFVKAGGNAIDTAHCYGEGRHRFVGRYLKERGRDTLVVMDKGCHPYGRKRVTRDDMRSDVSDSLSHMDIDHLDFFVLHRDDPEVPAGEIVEWLNELKNEGKIVAFGGSNWRHARIEEANEYAKKHNLQAFSLSSPNLALAVPQDEMWSGVHWLDRSDRNWFEQTNFPLFSWSSGSSGFFAGVENDDVKRVYHNPENFARRERASELAKKYGMSPTQISIAWILSQPLNAFAIVGPRTVEEVRENMQTASLQLSPEELAYLEFGA